MTGIDILLIYPPAEKINYLSAIPHLSAYLLIWGFSVSALDAPALKLGIPDIVSHAEALSPRTIGVSIPFTPLAKSGLETIKALKTSLPNIQIFCGGVHPTLKPEEFTDDADAVVMGEGETTLKELLEYHLRDQDYTHLKGIAYKKNGKLIINPPQKPLDLDDLPIPNWGIVEVNQYSLTLPTGQKAMPIQSSRGCPYSCNFCSNGILSNQKVRYKSIHRTIEELKHYIEDYGITNFDFRDENFTLNKERTSKLCKGLEKLNIKWWVQTRANLLEPELLAQMKQAGCIGVSIGVETGDAGILSKINKGVTLRDIEEAFIAIKKANLKTYALFMLGHPWDTPITIERTMKFADNLDPDYTGFALATPYPGTELRTIATLKGGIKTNDWSRYKTNQVTYIPPGLTGRDLQKIKKKVEAYFYLRKPQRIWAKLRSFGRLESKIAYLVRTITQYVPAYPIRSLARFPSSVKLGKHTYIEGNVSIGPDTYINARSHIVTGTNSKITIGQGCAISYNVHIRARTHNPLNIKKTIEKDIEIGDHVWIGANAIIREGITVGEHAIIGANSVVTHDVPPYHVVGGVPARLIYVKPTLPNTPKETKLISENDFEYEFDDMKVHA